MMTVGARVLFVVVNGCMVLNPQGAREGDC